MVNKPEPVAGAVRRSSLQQERSQQTRAALAEAAEVLWGEWGFDGAKVGDICDHAGVSKGLFYFYFPSKEDLLVEFILDDLDQVARAVHRADEAGEAIEAVLRKAVAVMARVAQRRPRHLLARGIAEWFAAVERHAALSAGHTALNEALIEAFRRAQQSGAISGDHTAEDLAELLEWALMRAELQWATSTSRQTALVRRLWDRAELILHGALSSKRRPRK